VPKNKYGTYYRALAEIPVGEWTRVCDLSREVSLGYLQRIMADWAEPQGYVERLNRNPHGARAIWMVQLTEKGKAFLREIGYTEKEYACTD
jgi:hypothetical protein